MKILKIHPAQVDVMFVFLLFELGYFLGCLCLLSIPSASAFEISKS